MRILYPLSSAAAVAQHWICEQRRSARRGAQRQEDYHVEQTEGAECLEPAHDPRNLSADEGAQ